MLIDEVLTRASATTLAAKQDKILTGYTPATTSALDPVDTLLEALGKLEKKTDETIAGAIAYTQRPALNIGIN